MTSNRPSYLISPASTLREAWLSLNTSTTGICLIVDEKDRLLDTITDGDIRRAILDSVSVDASIELVRNRKNLKPDRNPVVAEVGMEDFKILELMKAHKILHVPVLDETGRVVDLKLMRDLLPEPHPPLDALVMAGGFGKRLLPLTEDTPKPMLPVGGKPILEHIIDQLKTADIQKVVLSTHYRPETIRDHFGNGEGFGIEIEYVHETSPMGTAGALGYLESVEKPLLVMNGDIMTEVDFRQMLSFHLEQSADITVGVARYQFQVPFGVVDCQDSRIVSLSEKPEISVFVCAGIYLLSPKVVKYVERGTRVDMPELIQRVLDDGGVAASFPIVEYWLDIGRPAEYEKARGDYGG